MKRKDFSKLKVEVQKKKDFYFEHEDYIAGVLPFLRGIYSTMYFQEPLKLKISKEITLQENTTPEIELANFLTKSFRLIQNSLQDNTPFDTIVSQLSFRTTISENHFDEIAKMRAARMLWSCLIKQLDLTHQESFPLNIHAATPNSVSTLAAILGGCQNLISKDKSPLFIEEETCISKTVDPWAGSFYIEKRTAGIANAAWELFNKENNL